MRPSMGSVEAWVVHGGVDRVRLKQTFLNPAHSQVTVRYAVPEETDAAQVSVRPYDVLGRQVQTVRSGADAGRHETQLSVADLSSGVYILRLTAGSRTETQRLTVVK